MSDQVSYETIVYEVEGRSAIITFNRPERLNAINEQMIHELNDAYMRAERDDEIWTIIVAANGRAFCSGADVEKVPEDGKAPHEGRYLSQYKEWEAPQEATHPFRTMAKPMIVAVNGICCGAGMDLVTCGDIAIASDDVQFFDPHVSIGLVSGREIVRVARRLPYGVAMRMGMVGKHERMGAERAYQLGFVTEVVPRDRLLARAKEVAELINRNAPLAVRGTRLAVMKGLDLPMHEAEILAETFRERNLHTEDSLEGPRAFMEKRDPVWKAE